MTPRIQASYCPRGNGSPEKHVDKLENKIDISDTDILLVCNNDLLLAAQIVTRLRNAGAKKVQLCYPVDQTQVRYKT
jgi:hypothetical protein